MISAEIISLRYEKGVCIDLTSFLQLGSPGAGKKSA
jgi:hypothetical protein